MKHLLALLLVLVAVAALTAKFARAQDLPLLPAAPTSGFSSIYVQVVPVKVADLPACSASLSAGRAVVLDALAPAYLVALVGGGKVEVGALCNGTAWVAD